MTLNFSYESDLLKNMPENSGYLAIYISESRCDIAICSSSFVLVFLKSYTKETETDYVEFIKNIFSNHQSLFAQHYQAVNVGVHFPFTLIPYELELPANELLSFLTGKQQESQVDDIDFIHSEIAFHIPDDINTLINQSFEQPTVSHLGKISLELARKTNTDLFVLMDHEYFDIVAKKDNHIYSINRYKRQNNDDVVYFCLLALKDINVDPQIATIILSGYFEPNGSLHQNLSLFINHVSYERINDSITIRSDYSQPAHYAEAVLNLLNANN